MALSKIQSESMNLADDFAGMHFGGTATANQFDDYETGTWTPVFSTSSGSITMGSASAGYYLKVGDLVTVWGRTNTSSYSSPSGTLEVTGLPFQAGDASTYGWGAAINGTWGWSDHPKTIYAVPNTSKLRMWDSGTNGITGADMLSSGNNMFFSVSYRTT
jgi:hypothetical protein